MNTTSDRNALINEIQVYDDAGTGGGSNALVSSVSPSPSSTSTPEKYECDICPGAQSRKRSLKRHVRSRGHCIRAGLPLPAYACTKCDETFARDDLRKRHEERRHADGKQSSKQRHRPRRVSRLDAPQISKPQSMILPQPENNVPKLVQPAAVGIQNWHLWSANETSEYVQPAMLHSGATMLHANDSVPRADSYDPFLMVQPAHVQEDLVPPLHIRNVSEHYSQGSSGSTPSWYGPPRHKELDSLISPTFDIADDPELACPIDEAALLACEPAHDTGLGPLRPAMDMLSFNMSSLPYATVAECKYPITFDQGCHAVDGAAAMLQAADQQADHNWQDILPPLEFISAPQTTMPFGLYGSLTNHRLANAFNGLSFAYDPFPLATGVHLNAVPGCNVSIDTLYTFDHIGLPTGLV